MDLKALIRSRLGLATDPDEASTLLTLGGSSREAYDIAWSLVGEAGLQEPSRARALILLALLSGKTVAEVELLLTDLAQKSSLRGSAVSADSPDDAVEDDGAPTPLQGRMWQLLRQNPADASLNIVNVWTVEGQLEAEALQSALQDLVMRHDIFLHRVVAGENGPKVELRHGPAFLLRVWDLRSMERADQKETLDRLVTAYGRQAFDFQRSRPLRVLVVRLTADRYSIVIVTHHFQCDGTAMAVLYRDLCQLYEAHLSKTAIKVGRPSGAFSEHRRRSLATVATVRTSSATQFWKDYLKDATWGTVLLGDKGSRLSDPNQGRIHVRHIRKLQSPIEDFRSSTGVSNAAIFLSALTINLQIHGGAGDAVIGVVVSGRADPRERHTVAPLINTVPVRLPADLGKTFLSTVETVALSLRQGLAEAALPLGDILDVVKPTSDRPSGPISILFLYQDIPESQLELKGTTTTSGWRWDNRVARSDLMIEITPDLVGGFRLDIEYSTEIYSDDFVGAFAERFEGILRGALRAPKAALRTVDCLTEHDRHILAQMSTAPILEQFVPVPLLLSKAVSAHPRALAMSEGDSRIDYATLWAMSERIARGLLRRVPDLRGKPVALALPRSASFVASALGVLRAGGWYVALAPDGDDLAERLQTLSPAAVICSARARFKAGRNFEIVETAELIGSVSLSASEVVREAADLPGAFADPESAAFGTFTSGSTGLPKCVMCSHRGLWNRIQWGIKQFPLALGNPVLCRVPLTFVDHVAELFGALCGGAHLILPPVSVSESPSQLVHALRSSGSSRVTLAPQMLRSILAVLQRDGRGLPQLTSVLCSGDELSAALVKAFTHLLPHATLVNIYGASETTADATSYVTTGSAVGPNVPLGEPLPGVSVRIFSDSSAGAVPVVLPPGVAGLIGISGAALALGYLRGFDVGEGGPRFVDRVILEDGSLHRIYLTGDVGRINLDGQLQFLGRTRENVQINGIRVSLNDISRRLESLPEVQQCCVVPFEADHGTQVAAYLVLRREHSSQKSSQAPAELRNRIRQVLRGTVPLAVIDVCDALPVNANGKLDKSVLAAAARSQQLSGGPVEPFNELERAIADVWSSTLGGEYPGRQSNFFAAGGESYSGTEFINRLNEEYGLGLSYAHLWETPRFDEFCAFFLDSLRLAASLPDAEPVDSANASEGGA